MKTCLVLEGGALRGIYTAGVLDVLLENKVEIDTVIGVSAGALFGINYLSKQKQETEAASISRPFLLQIAPETRTYQQNPQVLITFPRQP